MRKIILAAAPVPAAALAIVLATGHPKPSATASSPGAPTVEAAYVAVPPPAPVQTPAPTDNLPTVDVKPFIVHTAPSDADSLPAKPYTLRPLSGRVAERALPRTEPRRPRATPAALEPATVSGQAAAAGGTALEIAGRQIALFGVKLLPRDNGAAARAALERHLNAAPAVTCTAPPGQSGAAAFVCRDRAGVDLGQFLVAQGLAAADRSKSYQYVADEDRARAAALGDWRSR